MIKIFHIQNAKQFEPISEAWNDLFERSGCVTPSLTSAHIFAFLKHRIPPEHQPAVILAEENGRLAGGIPLLTTKNRFLPAHSLFRTFSDLETYSAGFLAAPEADGVLFRKIVEYLGNLTPRWFSLSLTRIPEHSDSIRALSELDLIQTHTDFDGYGSYAQVPDDADDFVASLSSNFRKNLRKQSRRLDNLTDVEYRFVESQNASDACLKDFLALEASGWKGEKQTAIACSKRDTEFYRDLTTRLAQTGLLEWHFLRAEGKTIAGHLAIRTGRIMTLSKIAYDEKYSRCSPGNMLFLKMLEREIEQKSSDQINCLTDMSWHSNWRMSQRRYYNITSFRGKLIPMLVGYIPAKAVDRMRQSSILRKAARAIKTRLRRG